MDLHVQLKVYYTDQDHVNIWYWQRAGTNHYDTIKDGPRSYSNFRVENPRVEEFRNPSADEGVVFGSFKNGDESVRLHSSGIVFGWEGTSITDAFNWFRLLFRGQMFAYTRIETRKLEIQSGIAQSTIAIRLDKPSYRTERGGVGVLLSHRGAPPQLARHILPESLKVVSQHDRVSRRGFGGESTCANTDFHDAEVRPNGNTIRLGSEGFSKPWYNEETKEYDQAARTALTWGLDRLNTMAAKHFNSCGVNVDHFNGQSVVRHDYYAIGFNGFGWIKRTSAEGVVQALKPPMRNHTNRVALQQGIEYSMLPAAAEPCAQEEREAIHYRHNPFGAVGIGRQFAGMVYDNPKYIRDENDLTGMFVD